MRAASRAANANDGVYGFKKTPVKDFHFIVDGSLQVHVNVREPLKHDLNALPLSDADRHIRRDCCPHELSILATMNCTGDVQRAVSVNVAR